MFFKKPHAGRTPVVAGVAFACLVAVSCNQVTSPDPFASDESNNFTRGEVTLHFNALRSLVRPPGQVQFFFALRDLVGDAIVMPPDHLAQLTRIFEDGQPLDLSETNFFVSSAENFRMDVALVLDFTNSMASFQENGVTGIEQMILGAQEIIRALGTGHRIAIVEFHDRNPDPATLVDFTTDTTLVFARIDRFLQQATDHGATRVWDAVDTGLQLFAEADTPQDVRLLIFLSDGFDTSSRIVPSQLAQIARKRRVQIHCVGTGAVTNLDSLLLLTQQTEGVYYPAEDLASIRTQLQEIATNLRGQYRLSYVSLRQSKNPLVRVEVDYAGATNYFEKGINVLDSLADDRIGRITYHSQMEAGSNAKAFFWLEHTPRNITSFRFRVQMQQKLFAGFQVIPIRPEEGGLLSAAWNFDPPVFEEGGWVRFTLSARDANPLAFGAIGPFMQFDFDSLTANSYRIPFKIDNSIYTAGKSFKVEGAPADTVFLGLEIVPITPGEGVDGVGSSPELSWQLKDPRRLLYRFNIYLDTKMVDMSMVATGKVESRYRPVTPLPANTIHYWRIEAISGLNRYLGPIWSFQTGSQ